METYLLHIHHRSASFLPFPQRHRILLPLTIPSLPQRNLSAVVVTRSTNNTGAGGLAPVHARPAPASSEIKKTVYNDNWFNCLAISYMSSSIQATLGMKIMNTKGYEGFVEAATFISRTYGAMEQQQIVMEALKKAFPWFILFMASSPNFLQFSLTIKIRSLIAPSKFSRELFSRFTTIFFSWLVGPCEVRESEFHGRKENNVVYIHKCRFLEATNCVGMCTNLCKLPSQKFINKSLGMPTNMIPNFEDKSCEIIFGQLPPADDPALKQPCYHKSCIAKQIHGVDCSS
ncbi:hypothetical protein KFK09_027297 [Dendrobium nobile]|uniref:Beta-carotene isomerase D27-like C-terminal domain-containing protein n=1 Tax=Dendrobium nobile TaxID=94219 RepID=A0A8T3AAP7_DENNO|nr:hypothetical protein KFK09_027297 [Dendrobium nobile]